MTESGPLSFPTGRALSVWWPTLASHKPRALWLFLATLHRVEALVGLAPAPALGRLQRFLLERLVRSPVSLAELSQFLGLDLSLLRRLLGELQSAGLAQLAGECWASTEAGKNSLNLPHLPAVTWVRRRFSFLNGSPPRFVPLNEQVSLPTPGDAGPVLPELDLQILQQCLSADAGWKSRHGFPLEIQAIASPDPGSADAWRRVPLVRTEAGLLVVLIHGEGAASGLKAYPAVAASLAGDEPILTLGPAWPEILPELAREPTLDEWRQAWQSWGQSRNLPEQELAACDLHLEGPILQIRPPGSLLDSLHALRSEICKGEVWLLVGDGPTRRAARVDLVE